MNVLDGQPGGLYSPTSALGEGMGFVGRVVQNLNFQQLARIIDLGGLFKQPFDDVSFVINRKLDGDARKLAKAAGRLTGKLLAMLPVPADHFVTMQAVAGKHDQDGEIRHQDQPVEQDQVMDSRKRIIE